MIREDLANWIKKALKEAGFSLSEAITVERPERENHGDYTTNIALQVAKTLKMSPQKIAETLRNFILNYQPDFFEKIEVAEPGFINFFLSPKYLQKQIREILKQKEKYGNLEAGRKKKVNVEFISANPTGPLHIGNGRSAFAGDTISNILEKAGCKVTREYFINDAQVSRQIITIKDTVSQVTDSGAGMGLPYYSDYLHKKILEIKNPEKIVQYIQKDNRNFIEKKLKIKFDNWVSEEEDIYKKGKIKKVLNWLKEKGLVYKKDKAWWIKTSQFGEEKDWVVVRETGEPTYLLSDIAYHKDKFSRGFDRVVDIWGADHQAHVSKMKAAAQILGYAGDFDILILQLVALKGKEKISKRKGDIITLEDLVNEIGLDVARWFYLQKSLNTHMEIDLQQAKEQSEKNPVYYVQYAHARICNIIKKIKNNELRIKNFDSSLLSHPSELNLIRRLIGFPEVVEDTAKDYQVQRFPQYATSLAAAFHQFYRDCRVISDDKKITQARLALVFAAQIVFKNTLDLMGISAPKKM